MNRLKELNPNCLMAHSNLSVFYLAKGMIEEAEIAKAQSAVLQMQNATDERKAKEIAAEERERIQNEAQDRIEMFKEVLEIDEDDPVATFGLGKAYVQLNQYENAIPHLIHATEVQKDFSAAFLDLGKCYEFLEKNDLALETYAEGIAVASKKGDLMPMREMERRQKSLADIQTTDA
jgi:tetratricopeptide (TPR) repeat protein